MNEEYIPRDGNIVCARGDVKRTGLLNPCIRDICLALLIVFAIGSMAGFVWNITAAADSYNTPMKTKQNGVSPALPITETERESKTTMVPTGTEKMTSALSESSTRTTTSLLYSFANETLHAFKVLKTNVTVYGGYSFLVVKVEVPLDGISVSENWCRDYQHLCKQFSRRPTGCGIKYTQHQSYKSCAEVYDSDMEIDNVFGCSPSSNIAEAVNAAFPNTTPPAIANKNTFGFLRCGGTNCHNTIVGSQYSLYVMNDFWKSNKTTMYTVCS